MGTTEKRMKLPVFTLEECQQCHMKTKRPFKIGDYVFSAGGQCQNCKGATLIVAVFAEQVPRR
jgi:hypothetical protein